MYVWVCVRAKEKEKLCMKETRKYVSVYVRAFLLEMRHGVMYYDSIDVRV